MAASLVTIMVDCAHSYPDKAVRQWLEASIKVHSKQTVARMLEESRLEGDYHSNGTTALHIAACYDHDLVAARLLTEDPSLADVDNAYGWNALRTAATRGSGKVVAVLLTMTPHVIRAGDNLGRTALHFAAEAGHAGIVAQLLAADPDLVTVADIGCWNPIHFAASNGCDVVVDMMLTANPQLACSVGETGESVLHLACAHCFYSPDLFRRLLALNPAALRALSSYSNTPFDLAVSNGNDCAVEVLQWELTFEEIASAFTQHCRSFVKLRPIVEGQCACLVDSLLNRDVAGLVFEYLDLQATSGYDTVESGRK